MTVECDGVTLHVVERGGGVPLVLVHGFPHDGRLWAAQLDALGGVARLIVPDLRGFGRSVVPEAARQATTLDRHADDLACVLDAAGVRRAVVGGLSMGGYVALAFWRRHRARVRGLVLADTRAGADADEARAKRRELMGVARAEGPRAVADRMLEGMLGKTTRTRAPELVEHVRAMLARQPAEAMVAALQAMHDRPDATSDLATIDVPTLVVVGAEDVLTPVAEARLLHERIAGSRLAVIPGAGHVSSIERPAAFDHALRAFLATLPAEPAASDTDAAT